MGRWVGQWALYDGVPIGGIAVALALGTYAFLEAAPDPAVLVLLGGSAALVYQLDRTLGGSPEDEANRPGRVAWARRQRRYMWASIIVAGGAALGGLFFIQGTTRVLVAVLGGLSLLHVAPLLPGGRRLKRMGRGKPLVIALVWVGAVVGVPLVESGAAISLGLGALGAARLFFLLANVLLADWVDRRGDVQAGLETLATRWPTARVQRVAYGLLALSVAATGASVILLNLPWIMMVDAVGPLILGGVIAKLAAWPRAVRVPALDAVMAWPFVTAFVAWLATGL